MQCKEIKEVLWQVQAQEAGPQIRREVETHVQSCTACSKEQAILKALIQNMPIPPRLPESYWRSYNQKVMERLEAREPIKRFFLQAWAPALASLLVVLGTTFYFFHGNRVNLEEDEIVEQIEILDNLDVLDRDDFEKLTAGATHVQS